MSARDELPKYLPSYAADRDTPANIVKALAGDYSALAAALEWDATEEGPAFWMHAYRALRNDGVLPDAARRRLETILAEIRARQANPSAGRRVVIPERRRRAVAATAT